MPVVVVVSGRRIKGRVTDRTTETTTTEVVTITETIAYSDGTEEVRVLVPGSAAWRAAEARLNERGERS